MPNKKDSGKNPRKINLAMALAVLLSAIGFVIFIHSLSKYGLQTKRENFFYFDYELTQKGRDMQSQSNFYLPIQPRYIEPGVVEYSLNIHCNSFSRLAAASDICFDLSISERSKDLSAVLVFHNSSTGEEKIRFTTGLNREACQDGQLKLTRVPEYFKKQSEVISLNGTLKIRCAEKISLKIPLVISEKRHQTALFEIVTADDVKSPLKFNSGQLSGCVSYSSETAPAFTKAQLLAFTWGLGTTGQWVIYSLTFISFTLWICGVVLIFSNNKLFRFFKEYIFLRSLGFVCIFTAIFIIFTFVFPPFRGPDEVHHFSGYSEVIKKTTLRHDALKLSNLGSFYRIHRLQGEKISCIDTIFNNEFDWPKDVTNPYVLSRSPLGIVVWKFFGHFLPDKSAGHAVLSLRIASGFFVSICLLISLLFSGVKYSKKTIPVFSLIPFILVPSIAYFSTAISNYPFLIGGYAIQVITLGRLWMSLHDAKMQLDKVGALLGLGIAISLCSADNAMAVMPLWALALPGFLVARRGNDMSFSKLINESIRLVGSCFISTNIFCVAVSLTSIHHSFLPQMAAGKVSEILPMIHAPLAAGLVLLLIFFGVVSLLIILLGLFVIKLRNPFSEFHRKMFIWIILALIVVFLTNEIRIPEIDLSRGGETNSLVYALLVLSSFVDGFMPGSVDPMVSDSFWRQLGWLDTTLPIFIRELLRYACGFGLFLLFSECFSRKSNRSESFFFMSSILGLFGCVATVGFLYFQALYNVNSRYILIGYIFTAALATEGYRRILLKVHSRNLINAIFLTFIIALSILVMTSSWLSVLNRFF